MKKEFSISNDKVMINFTAKYCNTFESVLESNGFRRILEIYLNRAKKKNSISYRYLSKAMETEYYRYKKKFDLYNKISDNNGS